MASTDGFFFDFGDTSAAPVTSTDITAAAAVPDVPLSSFPWIDLDGPEREPWLAKWGGDYPHPSSSAHHKTGPSTRPLQLVLSPANSVDAITVCYQTAPELPVLTCAVADGEDEEGTPSAPAAPDRARAGRDIIKGKYYGGLKVWSCAPDLAQYLVDHAADFGRLFAPSAVASPVVVEVGCGQAIPALAALALGARRVIFMDYNDEVLQACTRPNVAATVRAAQAAGHGPSSARLCVAPRVQFVPGDWAHLQWDTAVDPEGCELILGTDVTFDEEACAKLAQLLQRWLKPKSGVAYIASKVYYFGTGGGAEELALSCSRHGLLTDVVKHVEADGGMQRVILRVCKP